MNKSVGARDRNQVRHKLQKIKNEHEANHAGYIGDCPKCTAAWQALETAINNTQRRHGNRKPNVERN